MSGLEDLPPEERDPDYEGDTEAIVIEIIEKLGRIALNFGLEAAEAPNIETDRPESIAEFSEVLKERIRKIEKDEDKLRAIEALDNAIEQLNLFLSLIRSY